MVRSFASLIGCALFLGAAWGLADLGWAVRQGAPGGGGAFLLAASTGAALGFTVFSLPALVVALAPRPRDRGRKLGGFLGILVVSPAVAPLGRSLYKRLPWDGSDALFAIVGLIAIATAMGTLGMFLARAFSGRGGRNAVRFLARAALPASLLIVPFALRVIPAAGLLRSGGRGDEAAHNLLLLTIDTLRADALGVMGDPAARTPRIDALARRSIAYTNCTAPSPWTLPSLGSALTGTYPGEHRLLENLSSLSETVPSLAEACRAVGLRTGAVVSNPWLATGALGVGFDTFEVAERLECLWPVRGSLTYRFLSKAALRLCGLDRAERVSANAIAWLESGHGAWFLWVHYFDPHLPNWPGSPWDRLFGPPPSLVGSSLTVEEIRETAIGNESGSRQEIERLYAGEVARTDHALGRVLDWLERSGRAENTAVVFSVDHGEEFWDHEGYGHGHEMFDEVVRVPLFVIPAGGSAPRIEPRLTGLVDLAPTALAAAELDKPSDRPFTGTNLLARDGGSTTYGEATLYGEEQKYLRTERWKLVFRPSGTSPRLSLFDLTEDPGEQRNLAPVRPAVRDSLFGVLEAWMDRVGSDGAMAARELPETLDPSIRDQLRSLGYIP